MDIITYLLVLAINIYIFIIVVEVALTWLIAFEVVNAASPQAQNLMSLLRRATDPVFRPLRKYIPPIGGIDITPLVVILVLALLKDAIS